MSHLSTLRSMTESHLDSYKLLGNDYVAIFRHRLDDDLAFVESFKRWEEYNAARKYWLNEGYVTHKLWDLDYIDYIREQNEVNVGTQ